MPRDNDRRSSRGRGGRRGRGGGGGGQRSYFPDQQNCQQPSDNPVVIQFGEFSKMLDDRHDRYERIVKLSRDITIESKRIIFCDFWNFLLYNLKVVVLTLIFKNRLWLALNANDDHSVRKLYYIV